MRRRDFTINAIARRLETGEILDPLGGREDLERRVLRTTSPTSFRDDPLRIVRGLRFVSQLGVEPDEDTLRQMREWAPRIEHVSAERIGGGLAADGMGELSKLLLGAQPAKALRLARDTGVLVHAAAGARAHDRLRPGEPLPRPAARRAHVPRSSRRPPTPAPRCAVRLAALLHDAGKPESSWRGSDGRLHFYAKPEVGKRSHEEIGAELASQALARLRYPTQLRSQVRRIVREHMFGVPRPNDAAEGAAVPPPPRRRARLRPRRRTGAPTSWASAQPGRRDRVASSSGSRASGGRSAASSSSPHRLDQLAVNGDDLIALGFAPGPALGDALEHLLSCVIGDPDLNTREWLLAEAERELRRMIMRWDVRGPYEVAFSTRVRRRQRGPVRLAQPRPDDAATTSSGSTRTAGGCAPRWAPTSDRLALNRQVHSTLVHRARAGRPRRARRRALDGRGRTCRSLALTADCLPIALARVNGDAPAVAVLHAGWRGLLGGIVAEGVADARRRRGRRRGRPGDRPVLLRGRAGGGGAVRRAASARASLRGRNLDLWTAAELALRAAGVDEVERVDLCTSCNPELFFSHRRDRQAARRAGRDRAVSPDEVRAAYERVRAEVGPGRDDRRGDEVRLAGGHGRAGRGRHRGRGGEPRPGARAQARRLRRRVPLALHRPPAVEQGEGREPHLRARATRSPRSRPRRA